MREASAALVADLRHVVLEGAALPAGVVRAGTSSNHVFRDGDHYVKFFKSAARGEPERELLGLRLLGEHLPGTAPRAVAFFDDRALPALVMTAVDGRPVDPHASSDVDALVDIECRMLDLGPAAIDGVRPATNAPGSSISRVEGIMARQGEAKAEALADATVSEAWGAAERWLAGADRVAHDRIRRTAFGRGDTNLNNYLIDGGVARVLDLEDCGVTDAAFHLADMAEHLQNHELPEATWSALANRLRFDVEDWTRFVESRRLLSIFWFGQLVTNPGARKYNPPERTLTQAQRVAALLDGSPPRLGSP